MIVYVIIMMDQRRKTVLPPVSPTERLIVYKLTCWHLPNVNRRDHDVYAIIFAAHSIARWRRRGGSESDRVFVTCSFVVKRKPMRNSLHIIMVIIENDYRMWCRVNEWTFAVTNWTKIKGKWSCETPSHRNVSLLAKASTFLPDSEIVEGWTRGSHKIWLFCA